VDKRLSGEGTKRFGSFPEEEEEEGGRGG